MIHGLHELLQLLHKVVTAKACIAKPLKRRLNRLFSSDAQTWNHHGTVFLQVRTSHICSEETQQKTRPSCESQENQQSECGWLHKQQPSS